MCCGHFCNVYVLLLSGFAIGQSLKFIKQDETDPKLLVQCNEGFVHGSTRETFRKQTPYLAYQGIPFAEPPIGELRFRDPIPVKSWSGFGVLDVTEENSGCVSSPLFSSLFEGLPRNSTEDCLYLNVYVPKITNKTNLLPVIIWIYGGSFVAGSSNAQFYGPDYYLENGIVVVTLNYRLGILGFFSTGDLECPGNMALKDQHLAIKWVKDNIENFGGDPDAVTISGQSAGSASVHYHMLAPKSRDMFRGVIAQSGTALNTWAYQKNARVIAFMAGYFMGVHTKDSKQLMDELRKIDVEKISSAEDIILVVYMTTSAGSDLAFAPVIEPEHEGAYITKRSYEACENGDFARVPILLGVNTQEAGFFQRLIRMVRPFLPVLDIFQLTSLLRNFNFNSLSIKNEAIQIIKSRYLRTGKFGEASLEEIAQYVSDDAFVRPAVKTAQLMSPYVPVYFYQLGYMGRSGLRSLNQESRLVKGVFHAEELFYLWRRNDTPVFTRSDEAFVDTLSTLWSNFVKYGDPTPSRDPKLANIIWDPVKTPKVNHLRIGKRLAKKNEIDFIDMDFWDGLLGKYTKKPYTTY